MSTTAELLTCSECTIPQPISQFQSVHRSGTSSKCLSCQLAIAVMTHAVRRKARAIASLVLNNQQPNPTQSRVCSKCHESKPLANFVSYQSRTIYTVQCSRCRDTSLRAKGRQPPRPPVAEPVAELVWVQIFVSPS